jgi:beta-phosphoglucomutase-like phosphatase (HAD superfamily)
MALEALIFDVDGTLANTEHDGHLRAFNETFKLFKLDWHWDSELYSDLLSVSGGKERLAHYINHYNPKLESDLSVNDIADIHNKKTEIFVNHVANGDISLRIGVDRLIKEVIESGLRLGIATTTSLQNVEALMTSTLGESVLDGFEVIGAGDIVKSKKPAPDIYQYVLNKMRLSSHECIAFEDSQIGFASATSAGLKTVVTLSEYNKTKFFEGALVVLDHLGDENQPFEIIKGNPTNHSFVNIGYLKELYEQDR